LRVGPGTSILVTVIRGTAFAALLLLSACKPPKYAVYASPDRDYLVNVPFAWAVVADQQDSSFRQVSFIGPYSSLFFRGAPSFSARWFVHRKAHHLPDGSLEVYSDASDFIRQTLVRVYGPEYMLHAQPSKESVETKPCGTDAARCVTEAKIGANKDLPAKVFIVVSAGALKSTHIGMAQDERGAAINPRKHEYVILPRAKGFYVLTYPATVSGYPKYKKEFNRFVNSFQLLKDGPDGQPVAHGTALPVKKS
jgi:hypothetical protein